MGLSQRMHDQGRGLDEAAVGREDGPAQAGVSFSRWAFVIGEIVTLSPV